MIENVTKKPTEAHGVVRPLSNGKNVRWHFIPSLATVHSNSSHGIDRKPLVRVHCNAEKTRVGVDQPLDIALLQIE